MFRLSRIAAVLALGCAASLSPALSGAATYLVDQQNPSSLYQDAAGNNAFFSGDANIVVNGNPLSISAGQFRLTGDNPSVAEFDFVSFCIELTQTIDLPEFYTDVVNPFTPMITNRISALVENAFALVTNSTAAAAFQLALWEIITDTTLNLGAGNFQVTSMGIPASIGQAATFLVNIGSGAWAPGDPADLVFLTSPDSQNLLALGVPDSDVPLPASFLLLGSAMIGLGYTGYRRRRDNTG